MGFQVTQDPQAKIQRTFDWSAWLSDGETISAATVTADDGFTIAGVSNDNDTVTFKGSGGTLGQRYRVVCHIITSAGEENDETLTVQILDN